MNTLLGNGYSVSDDNKLLSLPAVCDMLRDVYWRKSGTPEQIQKAIDGSTVCLGLYWEGIQRGFCRGISDGITFAWFCDVVVMRGFKNQGWGGKMFWELCTHPKLQGKVQLLDTRDSQSFYRKFGFVGDSWMRRILL